MHKQEILFLALLCMRLPYVWKSKSVSSEFFIVGIPTPSGVITYKLNYKYWSLFKIPILPQIKEKIQSQDTINEMLEGYIRNSDIKLIGSDNLCNIEKVVEQEVLPLFENDIIAQVAYIGFYTKS